MILNLLPSEVQKIHACEGVQGATYNLGNSELPLPLIHSLSLPQHPLSTCDPVHRVRTQEISVSPQVLDFLLFSPYLKKPKIEQPMIAKYLLLDL